MSTSHHPERNGRRHVESDGHGRQAKSFGNHNEFETTFGHHHDRSSLDAMAPPPPSALDTALSRAAEFGANLHEQDHHNSKSISLSNFDRPVHPADVTLRPEHHKPFLRGFSFSLTDMPGGSCTGRSPHYVGKSPGNDKPLPAAACGNPLEGIKRHWNETRASLAANRQIGGLPGGVGLDVVKADMKSCSSGVHVKVIVPHPLDGERLGLTMKSTVVAAIADPRAVQFGFELGDQILQINHFSVATFHDFARELLKALQVNRATGRPMEFDVLRSHASRMTPTDHAGFREASPNHRLPHCVSPPHPPCACRGSTPYVALPPQHSRPLPAPPFPTTTATSPCVCNHGIMAPCGPCMHLAPREAEQTICPVQTGWIQNTPVHPAVLSAPLGFPQSNTLHMDMRRLQMENAALAHENAKLRDHVSAVSSPSFSTC